MTRKPLGEEPAWRRKGARHAATHECLARAGECGTGLRAGPVIPPSLAFEGREAVIVRYADDFVVGFQEERDVARFLDDLKERLSRFGLDLHPKKTRQAEFGRFVAAHPKRHGQGMPETLDFPGFAPYVAQTRAGRFRLRREPIAKRIRRTLQRIGEVLRRGRHHDIREVGQWIGQVVNGWPKLLRSAGEQPVAAHVSASVETAVAEGLEREVAAGSIRVEEAEADEGAALAAGPHSVTVDGSKVRCQAREVRAVCRSGPARI